MESIRNMLTNATEFTLWHIREPYEPLTPKSLNIHHACWSDFFLVDVFQVSNCKWKKEMILSGTNRMDGREKTLVADCNKELPMTLHPLPMALGIAFLYLSGLPPWLALVSVTQTDTWTGNGLQALSGHPWESCDQIQGREPEPASWVLRDMGPSHPCSPSWLCINHLDVWEGHLAHPSHPRPEEPPPSPPPPECHDSQISAKCGK